MDKARSEARPSNPLFTKVRVKPAFLGIDRIVESLSAALTRAGARNVDAAVSDRTVQLAADEEMSEAFTALGSAVAQGAAVTIRGGLVKTETGEEQEKKGCALLSISMKGVGTAMALKKGMRAVLRVIRKHRGALKTRQKDGEIRINLYLPILRGS